MKYAKTDVRCDCGRVDDIVLKAKKKALNKEVAKDAGDVVSNVLDK